MRPGTAPACFDPFSAWTRKGEDLMFNASRRRARQMRRCVRTIREGIQATKGPTGWLEPLDHFVTNEFWRELTGTAGVAYGSFADFAVDVADFGLGVRTTPEAKLLRWALLELGHPGVRAEVLQRTVRLPGRPRTTLAPGESFQRFYKLPTSRTAVDRILLHLLESNHRDLLAKIGDGSLTAKAAAVEAWPGLFDVIALRQEAANLANIAAKGPKDQARTLRGCFRACGVKAQCALIASELEGELGLGLAKRWRELKARP